MFPLTLLLSASKWNKYYHEDWYDARMRPWYVGAATSPKDVVILVDNSGSIKMTEPNSLTQLVVRNLLDTLGPDDFVNVLLFQEEVHALVPGMDDKLVPVGIEMGRRGRCRYPSTYTKKNPLKPEISFE